MALKTFRSGDILLSVPERLLITTNTVLDSYLAPVIRRWDVISISYDISCNWRHLLCAYL